MAVLVEGISVIVRRDAIARGFNGGWDAFVAAVPNQTLCYDDDLARVGFMTPADVGAYVSVLEASGLVFIRDGQPVDLAVVDQLQGPTSATAWLEYSEVKTEGMTLRACWLAGQSPKSIACPAGWTFERSLSAGSVGVPNDRIEEYLTFRRREGGNDVYLDQRTGKEVYVGRPTIAGDSEPAIVTQLEAICHEVLAIEAKMETTWGKLRRGPLVKRLQGELLPAVEQLAGDVGRQLGFTHFTLGLILRILGRREEAELAFRKANDLQPGVVNTLRELVRCLGEQDKHAKALPFAREAVAVAPEDAGAWGNLAMCLIQHGAQDEARRALDQALRLDPDDQINHRIQAVWQQTFKP